MSDEGRTEIPPIVRAVAIAFPIVFYFGPAMVGAVDHGSVKGMALYGAFLLLAIVNVGDGVVETIRQRRARSTSQ